MRTVIILFCLTGFLHPQVTGQNHHERFNSIDVLHYQFRIDLNDSSDVIRGDALVEILFKTDMDQFYLDLKNQNDDGTGMVIEEVLEDGRKVRYVHQEDRILISIPVATKGIIRLYQIKYIGIPANGLIISKNKFGDRTFFGDNWPSRAQHWLPVVDHPSDKALVEFLVTAPGHYRVVANGSMINESHEGGLILSHWKTSVPLPTKLMVIGVSPFAVDHFQSSSGIPVSSWVYPQNRKEGFHDYSIAKRPLDFFESYIAPYPFAKLANVQSKTVYGGMENASCIFYRENTVTGKQTHETLFAHEIAHQWFGDAVSEQNWHHIWISEGFATYLTDIYLEQIHGREMFVASMLDEKGQIFRFARRRLAPIVDTTLPVSVRLLNKNTYEKAGWVLHMLRRKLGDTLFQECVRVFYAKYRYGNVLTEDFQVIVDSLSGRNFGSFFRQWFYQPGHPVLSANMKYRRNEIKLTISQHQEQYVFDFSLDIQIDYGKGKSTTKTLHINSPEQVFTISTEKKPAGIILDPDTWLLFEYYKSP